MYFPHFCAHAVNLDAGTCSECNKLMPRVNSEYPILTRKSIYKWLSDHTVDGDKLEVIYRNGEPVALINDRTLAMYSL